MKRPADTPAPDPGDVALVELRRRLLFAWVVPAIVLTLGAALETALFGLMGVASLGMWLQDLPVLVAVGLAFAAVRVAPAGWGAGVGLPSPRPAAALALMTALAVAVAWAGHFVVFEGFALSRDEDLALFQAVLIADGRLVGQAPAAWRELAAAIQHLFMMQVPGEDRGWWLSSYLPINSALQAVGLRLGLPGVVSPALAGVALVATFGAARRLWPDRPSAALMATGLLASSAQFLVTAMTPYAMTAHLALNMLWLWLFLRGGRAGHAGALVTGFLATGLHQLIFHPLFAAPFVLNLWLERRWRLAAAYTAGYAAIGLFWLSYWSLLYAWLGVHAAEAAPRDARMLVSLLGAFELRGLGLMAENLARFMSWQNVLVVPLVLLGAAPAWRAGGPARALLLGLVLTVAAMFLLLPGQSIGWGYRYLHGFLGAAALLATGAWMRLTERLDAPAQRQAGALALALTAVSLLLVPARGWQAHAAVAPYARAYQAIRASPAQVVLIAEDHVWFAATLARNDPDLSVRPVTMPLRSLDDARLARLCAAHTVQLFETTDAARYGVPTTEDPDRHAREAAQLARLKALGCGDAGFRSDGGPG